VIFLGRLAKFAVPSPLQKHKNILLFLLFVVVVVEEVVEVK
jgi:hypothetical protein